jgi:DNA-binding MarR family transcriptional regulator
MAVVKCPKCGSIFQSEAARFRALSPAALHILTHLPGSLRRGKVIPVRVVVEHTGYSVGTVHAALNELVAHGYLERAAVGPSGRRHFYRATSTLDQVLAQAGV